MAEDFLGHGNAFQQRRRQPAVELGAEFPQGRIGQFHGALQASFAVERHALGQRAIGHQGVGHQKLGHKLGRQGLETDQLAAGANRGQLPRGTGADEEVGIVDEGHLAPAHVGAQRQVVAETLAGAVFLVADQKLQRDERLVGGLGDHLQVRVAAGQHLDAARARAARIKPLLGPGLAEQGLGQT